jgi:hypothetical protein
MTDLGSLKGACICDSVQPGWTRVYDMPQGSTDSFVMETDFNYPWESIQRCSVCGQYWHQDTISGHANIETWEKITERQRADLLKKRGM